MIVWEGAFRALFRPELRKTQQLPIFGLDAYSGSPKKKKKENFRTSRDDILIERGCRPGLRLIAGSAPLQWCSSHDHERPWSGALPARSHALRA
jgi:hypothetical protein